MHWNDFYMLASLMELIAAATNDFMHVYPTFTGSSPVWSMSMRGFVIAPVRCVAFANVPIVSNKPIIYMPSLKRWISFAEPAAWTWNDSYLVGHFSDFEHLNSQTNESWLFPQASSRSYRVLQRAVAKREKQTQEVPTDGWAKNV